MNDYKELIRGMGKAPDCVLVDYHIQKTVKDFVYRENKKLEDFKLVYKKLDNTLSMVSKIKK